LKARWLCGRKKATIRSQRQGEVLKQALLRKYAQEGRIQGERNGPKRPRRPERLDPNRPPTGEYGIAIWLTPVTSGAAAFLAIS
jgi:hypothetical protein